MSFQLIKKRYSLDGLLLIDCATERFLVEIDDETSSCKVSTIPVSLFLTRWRHFPQKPGTTSEMKKHWRFFSCTRQTFNCFDLLILFFFGKMVFIRLASKIDVFWSYKMNKMNQIRKDKSEVFCKIVQFRNLVSCIAIDQGAMHETGF